MNYREMNRTSWNKHAVRYQKNSLLNTEQLDFGDPRCLTDDDLNLIGDVKNKRVIELGCGASNIGIILAKRGAQVKGIDISSGQIELARRNAINENVNINFEVSSIEDYEWKGKFDIVVSICALQYISDVNKIFERVQQHLKKGGFFLFSTNHPAFYTVEKNTISKGQKRKTCYLNEEPEKWVWEDNDVYTFTSFPHPIEYYINNLVKCGLAIERVHELVINHKASKSEKKILETLYPVLLVIKAKKP
jgi:2-polyprenyl-3-methyl-5-hydroxy-6-metoxy-1,4-benzoquinol methylase